MNRKHLHSVRKCYHKIQRRITEAKLIPRSDEEVNVAVVQMMSHKDLKVVSQDCVAFEQMLGKTGKHFVELVQLALLERAMGMTKPVPENAHEQRKL